MIRGVEVFLKRKRKKDKEESVQLYLRFFQVTVDFLDLDMRRKLEDVGYIIVAF